MDYTFTVKKLGNKWYLDIDHTDPFSILFNDKINKVFTLCDIYNEHELEIALIESSGFIMDNNIFLNDEDLLKYFTTDESFEMRFLVKDHEFSISSDMYDLLEYQFNPNFHKTYYRIEIHNWTI